MTNPECATCHREIPEGLSLIRYTKASPADRVFCGQTCREFHNHRHHLTPEDLHLRWLENQTLIAVSNRFLYGA